MVRYTSELKYFVGYRNHEFVWNYNFQIFRKGFKQEKVNSRNYVNI